jgi:hypothetical protein
VNAARETMATAPTEREWPAAGATGASSVCSDFSALPADVLALLDTAGSADFQSSAAWWSNFVQTVDVGAAVPQLRFWREGGHEGGRVTAVLPVLLNRQAGTITALGNYYTTRYAPMLASGIDKASAATALQGLLAALLRDEPRLHTLRFEPLQAGSLAETALRRALQANGCAVFGFHAFQNWLLPVTSDWPTYLAARDGKLRTTLSRMGRRFAARGGRLELIQAGTDRLEVGIAAYQAVYAASWKTAEPHPHFMPGLIRAAARSGVLRLGIAWLGDAPVAAQVWMVAGGRADIYKLAHDEAHKETSPGSLLTAMLMRHAFEQDCVSVVDYLSGDDGYKRLWMSEVHERTGLVAYRLRTPRGLLGAAREGAGRWLRGLYVRLRKAPSA